MPLEADKLFSNLANDTRLRSLMLLFQQGELCVCELTHALGLAQPQVSRHLALLRESGLVSDRRAGLWVYYRINPALPAWVKQTLETVHKGIGKQPPFRNDAKALASMTNRPDAPRCA